MPNPEEMPYGLHLKLFHEGRTSATAVSRLLRGLHLMRIGATMDRDMEYRLRHYYLSPERWFGIPILPLPFFRVSAAHCLHWTTTHLQMSSPRLADVWSDALVSITSDAVESALPASELTVQGIVDGCTEVVIADTLENGFKAMLGFFDALRARLARREKPGRARDVMNELPAHLDGPEIARPTMELAAVQTTASTVVMDTREIVVQLVSPSNVKASIEVGRSGTAPPAASL